MKSCFMAYLCWIGIISVKPKQNFLVYFGKYVQFHAQLFEYGTYLLLEPEIVAKKPNLLQ